MQTDEKENFEPLVVLQFSVSTPLSTKEWVIRRLTAKHSEDEGAGLLARFEPNQDKQVNKLFFS